MKRQILTNTVKYDDRVVNRESHEGQQRGQNRQTDFPLKDRKERQRDQNIVKNGDHSTGGVRPIVSKRDKEQDADQSEEGCNNSLVTQLSSGHRAHRVGTDDLVSGTFIFV